MNGTPDKEWFAHLSVQELRRMVSDIVEHADGDIPPRERPFVQRVNREIHRRENLIADRVEHSSRRL